MPSRFSPQDALSNDYAANPKSDLSDNTANDLYRLSRRSLIKHGAAAAVGTSALANALVSLAANNAQGAMQSRLTESPYGPIRPVADEVTGLELLQLPEGFKYATLSWTGDAMADAYPTPPGHDGMGVVAEEGDDIVLVRNHELSRGGAIVADACYETGTREDGTHASGGNTNLYFSRSEKRLRETRASLSGTMVNCAGGVTPWGTWLSCEETVYDGTSHGGKKHGYVFEVTADATSTTGMPITDMGRFEHEAVAVDPSNSYVYLTEDNRNHSAIYRFIPNDTSQQTGSLEKGGRLQAARVVGQERLDLFAPALGDRYRIDWVDIDQPDSPPEGEASGPYLQARAKGALSISRGEGIVYADGLIYIVDTSAGVDEDGAPGHGNGAIWMLNPATGELTCLFASVNEETANNPDNVTVSPRGAIVTSEDGGGVEDAFGFGERVLGIDPTGNSFIFAKNHIQMTDEQVKAAGKYVSAGDYRNREIAGVCFDPSGEFMFFNVQTPGITFAVWGPWQKGPF